MPTPGRGGPEVWAMLEVLLKSSYHGQCTHGYPGELEEHAGTMQ